MTKTLSKIIQTRILCLRDGSEQSQAMSEPEVHGWLVKRAVKSGRNWRRRFFVLSGDRLCWWKSELSDARRRAFLGIGGGSCPAPRGTFAIFKVSLVKCHEEGDADLPPNTPADGGTDGTRCLSVVTPTTGATLYAIAETPAERKRWARAVRACIGGEEASKGGPDWLGFDLGDADNALCGAAYSSAAFLGEALSQAESLGAWPNLHSAAVVQTCADAGRYAGEVGAVLARAPPGAVGVLRDLQRKVYDLQSRIGAAARAHPQGAGGAGAQQQSEAEELEAAISASRRERADSFEGELEQARQASASAHAEGEEALLEEALRASASEFSRESQRRRDDSFD